MAQHGMAASLTSPDLQLCFILLLRHTRGCLDEEHISDSVGTGLGVPCRWRRAYARVQQTPTQETCSCSDRSTLSKVCVNKF